MSKPSWWEISVGGGYGSFGFLGTEAEAEEMRAHKARWEGAAARKRAIPSSDPLVAKTIAQAEWEKANGYPESRWKHILKVPTVVQVKTERGVRGDINRA